MRKRFFALAAAALAVVPIATAETPVVGIRVYTDDGHSGLYDEVEMHLHRQPKVFIFSRRLFSDSFEDQ